MVDIAIVTFDGVDDLDLAGVASVLGKAAALAPLRLKLHYIGATRNTRPQTSQGLIVPCSTRSLIPAALVFPGGRAAMTVQPDSLFISWVRNCIASNVPIFTICSGASLVGRCGLLEGLRVAVHRDRKDIMAQEFGLVPARGLTIDGFVTSLAGAQPTGMTKSVAMGFHILDRIAADLVMPVRRQMEIFPVAQNQKDEWATATAQGDFDDGNRYD